MKIVVAHSKTNREIVGDFDICASEKDLRILVDCILEEIGDRDSDGKNFSFGWVQIREKTPWVNISGAPSHWDK